MISDDPEVQQIQGMIAALSHFNARNLTARHLKIMLAVEMFCKITKNKAYPRVAMIAKFIELHPEEFESELRDLVAHHYIHEVVPTYGTLILTYKLGPKGGTVMRMLLGKGKRKRGDPPA